MTQETRLLEQARCFDLAALGEIYDCYSAGVFRYAMRLLGDSDLAEDCVAETFSRFLKALRNGGGPKDYLQAYLYQIAHHWITDYYRRRPLPALPLDDEMVSHQDDPVRTAAENIERERVQAALLRLTPDQRQVIVLKYLEGWGNEAVAVQLEKPVGSIKALQHRALDALRRMLLPAREETYE
ncbi:MAG: sigma-70 family RNA polymerase sigma factor [Anaerolineaceae bacterium]|nr:sigma-70 family RNA polymerase sigma factor [Anaerolineaceae bacterium]